MSATSLIAIDGVLRKLVGGAPIIEGMRLYRSFALTGRVVLMSHECNDQLADWLELHGCISHDFVHACPRDLTMANQANVLRRQGYDIDLAVVPDPAEAHTLIQAGFNTILFTHGAYAHPSWRPDADKGVQPWGDIVELTAKMARMKAADHRLKADD